MKLYVVRHGETVSNKMMKVSGDEEALLTNNGVRQAGLLREEFNNIKFDYVFSSPLSRAYETAKLITDNEIIIDERLTEVSSGDWQGRLKSELPKVEYDLYKKGLLNPPNGESLDDVDKRIKSFLKDIFSKYKADEKLLVVTHNAFMRNLKRMFIDKDKVTEPKNLEIYIVDDEMYKKIEKER